MWVNISLFWRRLTTPLSNYLNKKRGTNCTNCKYNNGLTCTAGLEWYEKCSGLINKGFTAR